MDITQSIVVVSWVFVIEPAFEEETRSRHMANNPFSVPFWICISMYSWSTKLKVCVFLVSFLQVGLQRGYYIRIGGQSADVGKGKMASAMKRELQSIARRGMWWSGLIEAAWWLVFVLLLL
jgi:hypothetical protein